MRQINLLPDELQAREVKQRTIPFIVVAIIAGIGAVVVPWLALRQVNDALNTQVTSRQSQVGLVVSAQSIAAAQQQNTDLLDVTKRIQVLNILAKQQIDWASVFSVVEGSIPKDVVLTNFHVADTASTVTLDMAGSAPSNLSFASFIDSLKLNTHFSVLLVNGFTYDATNGSVTFSLTASIKPADVEFKVSS